jgi:hypothetical protein
MTYAELKQEFKYAAERRRRQPQAGEDYQHNREAAEILNRLAVTSDDVPKDLLEPFEAAAFYRNRQYGAEWLQPLFGLFDGIGFDSWPQNACDFIRYYLAVHKYRAIAGKRKAAAR